MSFDAWRKSAYYREAYNKHFLPSSTYKTENNEAGMFTMSGNAESPAVVEQKKRYEQALKDIEELKKKHPHATFSMKTPFALMTESEFQEYVNRNNINPKDLPLPARNETGVRPQNGSPDAGPATRAAQPGESVDWSNSNCVGEVRDQAQCALRSAAHQL
ncbi:hypothetical protein P43SY_011979 [Pythium insidiosum]|uniref:Uncharacterized protein n=1 Tax=Pythium insidiosum TaxID=114742 RepID=A0AAD5L4J2_PYTIN|nr:hypothetical protein P43SY_011979 [Pythium insidiosum]